ncbi:MAG: flagellar type III secretion system pore protein FliP [Alphaproteobacteria bacterium]|nr:flagellar type III secretion system pore protein FliP [Alphaproteobacteria bacterium]
MERGRKRLANSRGRRSFGRVGRFGIGCALALLTVVDTASAQTVTLDLSGGSMSRTMLQLFALTAFLALAPAIVVTITSFTRLVVVLSLLRSAIGLQQSPPNIVLTSLAIFLTIFIMGPTLEKALNEGVAPYMDETISEQQAFERTAAPFKAFMLRNVGEGELNLMQGVAARRLGIPAPQTPSEVNLRVLVPAFMLSELRIAFEMGFLIFLPFLVIDVVVASVLMSMGMMMVPPVLIALPIKLIYFVYSGGWMMLVGALIESYL